MRFNQKQKLTGKDIMKISVKKRFLNSLKFGEKESEK